jgi:putative transposase
MYEWRKMTAEQREEALGLRRNCHRPWHSPPHKDCGPGSYHLSAACYEHKPIIGVTPQRMAECEARLLDTIWEFVQEIFAWCVLPNHYHLLIETGRIANVLASIGKFHGRQSYEWNGQDNARGRQVWHGCTERAIRSERHFGATMNYVHHNPVHHGYCRQWQDWPFSSASAFLQSVGKEEAARIWNAYPILEYGKGWDDPEM